MSEKDLIEKIPNWEYTYIYEGSRTCGKSYIQHLLDDKDKEIERLNNIINEYEEKAQMLDSVCRSLEFSAPENDYIFKERLREIIDELKELKENK